MTQPTTVILPAKREATNLEALLPQPYSMSNGAAIKTGARHARSGILVFMDAGGQHDPEDIPRLLAKLDEGYEMVVGARQADTQASLGRRLANHGYNRLASWMTGYNIEDLTSGFRAVRARHFRKFLYLLPNGFSYPTTSTMAFFSATSTRSATVGSCARLCGGDVAHAATGSARGLRDRHGRTVQRA